MILVLENDEDIERDLERYLDSLSEEKDIVTNADNVENAVMMEKFTTCSTLIVKPTLVEYSQYNLMLMLMYDLLTKGKLGIKEIVFFHPLEDELTKELQEIWDEKRKYLDIVLQHVAVYQVLSYHFPERIKLEI